MLHTYSLGVPVVQLIEADNIWIGAPLAIVTFFLDKFLAATKRATADFVQRVKEARRMEDSLAEAGNNDMKQILDLQVESLALLVAPLGLLDVVQRATKHLLQSYQAWLRRRFPESRPDHVSERLAAWTRRTLRWMYFLGACQRFLNSIAMICLVPLLCLLYVVAVFPNLPQTLGGGRPIPVQLIVSEEALPNAKEFHDWLSTIQSEPPVAKGSFVVLVTLYFRTDHELYVRKGSGPIVSLSDHAIEGIVFPESAKSGQSPTSP